jgi:protein involved in polysaccharide export with SLBB domain
MNKNAHGLLAVLIAGSLFSPPLGAQSRISAPAMPVRVTVTGEVRTPGPLNLAQPDVSLLDALMLAGSMTSNAGDEIIVVSRPKNGGDPKRITVLRQDVEQSTPGSNVTLQNGDIINVPVALRFYVSGFVKNAGSFILHSGLTVAQAIILAGGLADRGSDERIVIRRLVDQQMIDVTVSLDDKVLRNDELKIPSRY